MTTLITGAGQIGTHAAMLLLDQGERPVLLDVNPRLDFIGWRLGRRDVTLERVDIRDADALAGAMRRHGVDRVIHTAAMLPPGTESEALLATDVNVRGTANVLEAARVAGVRRVVFCSTVALYDMRAIRGERMVEDDALRPESVYGASKLYGELLGRNFSQRRGVEFVTLRFAHIYGPAPLPVRPGIASFVGELASACLDGRGGALRARTSVPREYVYVLDVARATVLAVQASSIGHDVINIGTGVLHHPDEMARIARGIAVGADISVDYGERSAARHEIAARPFDLERASREIGYAPQFDLEGGIRHFMSCLASNRSTEGVN